MSNKSITQRNFLILVEKFLSERLDNDPNDTRCGCFLPDLTGLARRSPAPTSQSYNIMK